MMNRTENSDLVCKQCDMVESAPPNPAATARLGNFHNALAFHPSQSNFHDSTWLRSCDARACVSRVGAGD
jgi:hypothetical protein